MLITEILVESREQKKPKGAYKPAPKSADQTQTVKQIRPVLAATFQKSFEQNVQRHEYKQSITKNFLEFVALKVHYPNQRNPKDLHWDSSNVFSQNKIYHAKVASDHRLFYTWNNLGDVTYLVLLGIYTHDHSGIGSPTNPNLQRTLADRFNAAKDATDTYRDLKPS